MQLVILTNRLDKYVHEAVATAREYVTGWTHLVLVDDSGDADHRARLRDTYPDATIYHVAPHPAGFTRAMATALTVMRGDHAMLWEEDFRPLTHIHLPDLARLLDADDTLAQVALLRGPWFDNEHKHGGVIPAREAEGAAFTREGELIVHTDHFTTNPTVLPRRTFTRPWPQVSWSESMFARSLVADGMRFAYLDRGVVVDHIGQREGFGY